MKSVLQQVKLLCAGILVLLTAPVQGQPHVYDWGLSLSSLEGYSCNAYATATDAEGNVYTTGSFLGSVDFDPGPGEYKVTTTNVGIDQNAYVTKVNAAGQLVWARCFLGEGICVGRAISLDKEGNVYTTGYFMGSNADGIDFDPGTGHKGMTTNGLLDIFVSKLDAAGNFVWADHAMSADFGFNMGCAIHADDHGSVYVAGMFFGDMDFDPGPGTHILSGNPYDDNAYLWRLNAADGKLVWVSQVEGESKSWGNGVVSDASHGKVYLTGAFSGTLDFDPGSDTTLMSAYGDNTGYLLQLDTSGKFQWVKQIGGVSFSSANSCDVLGIGLHNQDLFLTGKFNGTIDFNPGSGTYDMTATPGQFGCFALKLDTGGVFKWARHITGDKYNIGHALSTDRRGNLYIAGSFSGTTDLDPAAGTSHHVTARWRDQDIFIVKLRPDGSYVWGGQMGATGGGEELDISVDLHGNIYMAGEFLTASDFNPGPDEDTITSPAGVGVFIVRMRCNDTAAVTVTAAACRQYSLNGVTYTESGRYEQRLPNVSGCDSVITLNLTVTKVDAGVTRDPDGSLNAHASGATYQWIDCSDGTPVAGATEQTFLGELGRSYSVVVSRDGCSDTSDCMTVSMGIGDAGGFGLYRLYPNPASGTVSLTTGVPLQAGTGTITNSVGQVIWRRQELRGDRFVFDVGGLPRGVYILDVKDGDRKIRTKLVLR